MKPPRFKLVTLFAVITVISILLGCVTWVGRTINRIREREALSMLEGVVYGSDSPDRRSLPWLWKTLGAKPMSEITVFSEVSPVVYSRLVYTFPEANVHRASDLLESERGAGREHVSDEPTDPARIEP